MRGPQVNNNPGWVTPPSPVDPATWAIARTMTRADTDRGIGLLTEFKRIIEEYDAYRVVWVTKESEAEVIESPPLYSEDIPELKRFCFIHYKQITPQGPEIPPSVNEYLHVNSWYLRKAGWQVIGYLTGISWYAGLLQLTPKEVLGYYPEFREYLKKLQSQQIKTTEDEMIIVHLELFLDFLALEFKFILAELEDLARTREVTSAYFWALYKPNKLYVIQSATTSAPIVVRLTARYSDQASELNVEYFSKDDDKYTWVQSTVPVPIIYGRVAATSVFPYPIEYQPNLEEFKQALIARGRKWVEYNGLLHKYYDGVAYAGGQIEVMLRDRVIIDRASYFSQPTNLLTDPWAPAAPITVPPGPLSPNILGEFLIEPTDDNLLLAPDHVYGFSLTDKRWFIFKVENLHPITWDSTAFQQLSLAKERKALLQSLIDFHRADSSFNDIIDGKGRGLVLNLFGPPGTGKTLTAEAISEHVQKPLYRVTAGELGTSSSFVRTSLAGIFSLCARWDAIILLDEADIFLESRANREVGRNAMVSVFLRELEYFDGILFLTTNRIETFDPAFQSRIHVSLRYDPLSFSSRCEIWLSLLQRSGYDHEKHPLQDEELAVLSNSVKNGREIRNIIRTAEAVAASNKETLSYRHLLQVKDVSNAFEMTEGMKTPLSEVATQTLSLRQEWWVQDLFKTLASARFIPFFVALGALVVIAVAPSRS